MKRRRHRLGSGPRACALAAAVLLSACDAKTRSFFAPPLGSDGVPPAGLTGRVTLDDEPLDRVRVTLDPTGRTTNTDTTGVYAFIPLPPGAYRVRISNLPPKAFCPENDVDFDAASGELSVIDFACVTGGTILGVLSIDGAPFDSIPITITGVSGGPGATVVSDSSGAFDAPGLPPGDYEVTPGPLPAGAVCVPPTEIVSVGAGEDVVVSFDCTVLGDVTGAVTLDGAPFEGVAVSLDGTASRAASTDAAGEFAFADVPAGDVVVSISGIGSGVVCNAVMRSATVIAAQSVRVTFDCATGEAPPPPPPGPSVGYEFGFTGGSGVCGALLPEVEAGTVSVTPSGLSIVSAHLASPVTGPFDPGTGTFVGTSGWLSTSSTFPFPVELSEDWDVTFQTDSLGLADFAGTATVRIRHASTQQVVCQDVYQVTGTRG